MRLDLLLIDQELVVGMKLGKRPMYQSKASASDQWLLQLLLVDDLETLKAQRTIRKECIGKVLLKEHPIEPWCCYLLKSHLGNQVRSLQQMLVLGG